MKKELTLVVGSSGTVGSELLKLLKEQGLHVRATTSKQVVENRSDLVHLNLATGEGLSKAFEGVDKVFLLSPPGYVDQYAMLSPLIQEAKRRNLKKVVLMTAMGANTDQTSPFRRAELELENSGLAYNIIRPNWFFQNFNTFWIQGINKQGQILLPAGAAKVGFIDARDIAAVAAKLLTSEEFANQDFDLTGPEAVDHVQVAAVLSEVSGKKIMYQEIDTDTFKTGLVKAGLPVDYADFLILIFGFLRQGYSAGLTENVQKIFGRAPRSLSTYAEDYKFAWK